MYVTEPKDLTQGEYDIRHLNLSRVAHSIMALNYNNDS